MSARRAAPRLLPPPPSAGPAVEREVAFDMIRRSLPVLPVLVLVAGLIWGVDGALSAAFAIGLVLVNYVVAASLLAWSARIALALMMVAALGGFVVRLVLITVAVLAVKDQAWVELVPLGMTLIVTHLGLLIWEARHLSLSLAYPTVKPAAPARMTSILSALHFPPIEELLEWRALLFEGTPFEVNKVVLLMWASVAIVFWLFWAAGKKAASGNLVPSGVQNIVESGVEFVRKDIIMQTMGPAGLPWTPFLVTLFFFIFVTNIWEVIPGIQFPVNARMALPAFMALLVWAIFNYVGIKAQGLGGYLKSIVFPPGVPKGLLPLVALIEFISTIFVRPFSLAVRLFANMLAGHLLLVTFAVLSAALFTKSILVVILPLPFAMLILLTGFEILVAGLQAFIFTILAAVYIGGAMHPEH